MLNDLFIHFDWYAYLLLPLLIFIARVTDQSLGILRISFATKGFTIPVFVFGFFESFVWLLAIGQIMSKIDNIYYYVVFAAGFATGNIVGIFLERRLSIGYVMVRVVFQKDSEISLALLKQHGFRLTLVDAMGMEHPVKMIFSTIRRSQIEEFIGVLKQNNPAAFFTIEDVKQVKEGYFTGKKRRLNPFNR